MNIFIYERISTQEERQLQKYDRQNHIIIKYLKDNGIDPDDVLLFQEDASAKDFNRQKWQKLERLVQKDDTIIFSDISRFSRELDNGFNKYMELMQKGVNLVFVRNNNISTQYIKELLNIADTIQTDYITADLKEFLIKLLVKSELERAEKERLIMIQRIKDGLNASGKKSGRKPGSLIKITPGLERDLIIYNNDRNIKAADLMKKHNISFNTLKKYALYVKNNS